MKLLVVCQYYWPEQFQVTQICEGLVKRGHEVTVLCGLPNVNLPEGMTDSVGTVPVGYRGGRNRKQSRNGVRIIRSFEIGRRSGITWRVLNYYSFWKSSSRKVLSLGDFDAVFAYQLSPAMMCDCARVLKLRKGIPFLLYCCDLWPESMKAMLGDRFGLVVGHYGRVCRKMYQAADKVAVQTTAFFDYFKRYHGLDDSRLVYIPQFATDAAEFSPQPHEGVNVLFMGNMGKVQKIDFMLRAFERCSNVPGLRFHFVGDGSELENAKQYVAQRGLEKRVTFHGRYPISEMGHFYSIADICVMGLDDSSLVGLTIPSKIQGYMMAGLPIVAAAGGGTRFVVEDADCGIVVNPSDEEGFANALQVLATDSARRKKNGENGRAYAQKHFTREAFLNAVERELKQLAAERFA